MAELASASVVKIPSASVPRPAAIMAAAVGPEGSSACAAPSPGAVGVGTGVVSTAMSSPFSGPARPS